MRFVTVLCLSASATFLAACDRPEEVVIAPPECSWSDPIEFSDETKEWLAEQDWPESAYDDFNQIGDHNELHEQFCE